MPGREYCRWHDPASRQKHIEESRKGGLTKAYGSLASVGALDQIEGVSELDLRTAEGLRDYLAATLKQLSRLPFDARISNSIANLATAQRGLIETQVLEQRLNALEEKARNANQ